MTLHRWCRLYAWLASKMWPATHDDDIRTALVEAFSDMLWRAAERQSWIGAQVVAVRELVDLVATGTRERTAGARRVPTWRPRFIGADLRYAMRGLRTDAGFTAIMLITLALGLGINTAVYTVVNGVMFRPLPYAEADELVMVWALETEGVFVGKTTVTAADYRTWQEEVTAFARLAAFNLWFPTVASGGRAERVFAGVVTPGFFETLGVRPVLGRGIARGEGRAKVVVLSYGFWQRWFAGADDALGGSVTLNGEAYEVIGVMPSGYRHPDPHRPLQDAQFWAPLPLDDAASARTRRFLRLVGRLAPGKTVAGAQTELQTVADRLAAISPETNRGRTGVVVPLRAEFFGSLRPALAMVAAGGGLVLLIVCANLANLVLARSHRRRPEFAVRMALGAGRARLARQLMTEHVVLAAAGGGLALAVVAVSLNALRGVQGRYISVIADIGMDIRVLAVMAGMATMVGVGFGLLPLLEVGKTGVRGVLSADAARSGTSRGAIRFRPALVIAELALAMALVTGAGLLTRSLTNLLSVRPGFDAAGVVTFEITASRWRYPQDADVIAYYDRLTAALETLPSVRSVALTSDLPFIGQDASRDVEIEGSIMTPEYRIVGPGYFTTLGIALLEGREFGRADGPGGPPTVIVNRALARQAWPEGSAPARRMTLTSSTATPPRTVVGLVDDVLDDGFDASREPLFYVPFHQSPTSRMAVAVRVDGDPEAVVDPILSAIQRVDAELPHTTPEPYAQLIAGTAAAQRLAAVLAAAFSLLALLLAALGVYGVMSYAMGMRTREIGIRTALGATGGDVARLVFRQTLVLTSAGLAMGVVLAALGGRVLASRLFGVGGNDPLILASAVLVLAAVALVATAVPARRAARVEPVQALRVP